MVISGGWLTVNRACNMRCPWCYASGTKYDKNATMPLDLAKRLIDIFRDLKVKTMIVLGGEPTIYPHLNDVIRYSNEQGIKPVIVSNGKKLSDYSYVLSLKEVGLSELTISLKAVEPEEYMRLTNRKNANLFQSICTAINNVQSVGLGLNLSITLVRSFVGRLHELTDLLVRLRPSHTTIDMGSPIITPDGMDATGLLSPVEMSEMLVSLHNLLKMTDLNYSFYISIPLCIIDEPARSDILNGGRVLTTCHVPKGQGLVFTPDGHVVICNHFSSFPIGQFGVDFQTAKEFNGYWNSEKIVALRSRASMYPHERCRRCQEWNVCGGGCPVKWLYWDPKDFISDEKESGDG